MILNPSCSVIVCKIPIYKDGAFILSDKEDFSTDCYPNGAIDYFISAVKQIKKDGLKKMQAIPNLDYVDSSGGGGHWDYIEKAWQLAILYGAGELAEKKAKELDDKMWSTGNDPILTKKCEECLEKEPKKDCKEIVKRMVGECKGKFQKTLYDAIDEKYKKMQEVNDGKRN